MYKGLVGRKRRELAEKEQSAGRFFCGRDRCGSSDTAIAALRGDSPPRGLVSTEARSAGARAVAARGASMPCTVSSRPRSPAARPGRPDAAHLRRETPTSGDFGGALVGWGGARLARNRLPAVEFMRRYAAQGPRAGEFLGGFSRTERGKTCQKSSAQRRICAQQGPRAGNFRASLVGRGGAKLAKNRLPPCRFVEAQAHGLGAGPARLEISRRRAGERADSRPPDGHARVLGHPQTAPVHKSENSRQEDPASVRLSFCGVPS